MIDERTEAILLEALSETNGGERVTVDRFGDDVVTMSTGDLTVTLSEPPVSLTISRPPGRPRYLTPEDCLIAVEALDAYLRLSEIMASLPGGSRTHAAASTAIRSVREKLRARL